ncbi:MAG: alpha/beta hydrolase [Bacteroidetes bacterium HGW-Bacteroidetes-2]|jgi:dienelactone hydrolase|nr:MAG: alpha/beta hydrolase [Bacteroidetes bacterium HGW-Bacteroidetes-2]
MHIKTQKNLVIKRTNNKPIVLDIYALDNNQKKPLVIYCHGYKGFKDWGANNLIAHQFALNGIVFLKFNFSHNGGTTEQPIDFPDLDAFANNTFSKELDDIDTVLNWVFSEKKFVDVININNITIIGHSRGAGISIIKAEEDARIQKVVSWAGVSDFESRFPAGETLLQWKKDGVTYIENSRTKQQMPLSYQLYEDLIKNRERLNIQRAAKKLNKPHLIVHGSLDPTVSITEAQQLHSWSKKSKLEIMEGSNHVFHALHPWTEQNMPTDLEKVVQKTITFIGSNKLETEFFSH